MSEEARARDRAHSDLYHEVRIAAEAHRQVAKYSVCQKNTVCVKKMSQVFKNNFWHVISRHFYLEWH